MEVELMKTNGIGTSTIVVIIVILAIAGIGCYFVMKGGAEFEELMSIEGNIIFSVKEGYEGYISISEPRIRLSMATKKIYPCCNWSIISEIVVQSNKISIDFLGIYVPGACLTVIGPAISTSFLDISTGEYSLYFSYGNITDRYVLSVTDSFIKITEDVSQFTKPGFKLFWRYPPNSFAYICGTTTETSWIYEDFLDTLLSEIDLEEFQFSDFGEIPYPSSTGLGRDYDRPAKYFFYEKDEDFDKAGEVLKSYTQDVIVQYSGADSGVGISLISWKNKRYYSWLFEN